MAMYKTNPMSLTAGQLSALRSNRENMSRDEEGGRAGDEENRGDRGRDFNPRMSFIRPPHDKKGSPTPQPGPQPTNVNDIWDSWLLI